MGVTQTSIDSYKALQPKLGQKQETLYNFFKTSPHNTFSDREIAKLLGWSINTVTPRRGEIYALKLIEPADIQWDTVTKRNVQTWRLKQ